MPGSTPRSDCSTLRTSCSQGISSTMRSAIYTPAATVAVFPSIVAEAGPLVLIDAMASGCYPMGTYFAGMGANIDIAASALDPQQGQYMRLRRDP